VVLSFRHKTILVAGTGYTGEIKKGIFSILNFRLPQQGVLPMHCSANIGAQGDTAIFFGLSGTGKTTLSTDPARKLIGDDEHGWSDDGVFNFEGGCYAKLINLTREREPQIFEAIRPGALVENTPFFKGTNTINFADNAITENTRVSYRLSNLRCFWRAAAHCAINVGAGHVPVYFRLHRKSGRYRNRRHRTAAHL
jgi:phosphoenolpyruvate carboxykinase (ATP)